MKIRKAKKTGKKRWMLDLGEINGKRQRLFYELEDEAKAAMEGRKLILQQRGEEALAMSTPTRLEYIAADEIVKAMGVTITHVVHYYKTHAAHLIVKPLAEAVAECVAAKIAAGNRDRYTTALKHALGTLCKAHPQAKVSTITREQVEAWARTGGKAMATIRGKLIDAKTFFNFCLKRKWLLENPCNGIERVKLEDKPPGIHAVAEVKALLKCAQEHDPALLGYLCPLYFGGLRPAEAKKLIAAEVHSDVLEVTGKKSKTRQRRFVGINKTLAVWLKVPGVVPGMSPRSRRLDKLRWILGGRKMRKTPKGRNVRDVNGFPWPHDALRHSFCSYALPIYGATKTAEMAGHSEAILFAHYRERVKPEDAKKFWALRP